MWIHGRLSCQTHAALRPTHARSAADRINTFSRREGSPVILNTPPTMRPGNALCKAREAHYRRKRWAQGLRSPSSGVADG